MVANEPVKTESNTASSGIVIRTGRLSDLHTILSLARTVFHPQKIDSPIYFWPLFRHWPGVKVAEIDGKIVGYVLGRVSRWPFMGRIGGISSLGVHPDYLHQGIGQKLMLGVMDYLLNIRVKAIELEVSTENSVAQSLYRKLGFEKSEDLPNYYGPEKNGIRMRYLPD